MKAQMTLIDQMANLVFDAEKKAFRIGTDDDSRKLICEELAAEYGLVMPDGFGRTTYPDWLIMIVADRQEHVFNACQNDNS